jgi:hypothetical protein
MKLLAWMLLWIGTACVLSLIHAPSGLSMIAGVLTLHLGRYLELFE